MVACHSDDEVLERGRSVYNVYCTPSPHRELGWKGIGMICASAGTRRRALSFARLRSRADWGTLLSL